MDFPCDNFPDEFGSVVDVVNCAVVKNDKLSKNVAVATTFTYLYTI